MLCTIQETRLGTSWSPPYLKRSELQQVLEDFWGISFLDVKNAGVSALNRAFLETKFRDSIFSGKSVTTLLFTLQKGRFVSNPTVPGGVQ